MSIFALVDCNNFYVSCERVFRPDLNNKPVVVLSNNDGCIVSRSNEVKRLGIKAGTPLYQVRKDLDSIGATTFSSNYTLYGDLSSRVMEILSGCSPDIEVYSIDEAFLDLTNILFKNGIEDYVKDIKDKILMWVGIPTGIGVAPTKTLAKIANNYAKKNDGILVVLEKKEIDKLLEITPVNEIWGVGRKTAPKLNNIGIFNAKQLADTEQNILQKKFNINIARTALELNGIEAINEDNTPTSSKSISSSRTFSQQVSNLRELKEAIGTFTSIAAKKLRKEGLLAKSITVYLRTNRHNKNIYQQHESITKEVPATNSTKELIKASTSAIEVLFKNDIPYSKCGVTLNHLISENNVETDLFTETKPKPCKLSNTIDEINKKMGNNCLFFLGNGIKQNWRMRSDNCSPKWTTSWEELLKVK